MSTENQVHLIGQFQHDEELAADTITPGMLVELTTAGTVQPHSTEGGRAELLFAEVDALQGNTLDDDYSEDDLVMINIEEEGNEGQAWLAAGEDVDIGDELISEGTGMLIENGNESSGVTVVQVVAIAREALDLSASGAVDTLMRVRYVTV